MGRDRVSATVWGRDTVGRITQGVLETHQEPIRLGGVHQRDRAIVVHRRCNLEGAQHPCAHRRDRPLSTKPPARRGPVSRVRVEPMGRGGLLLRTALLVISATASPKRPTRGSTGKARSMLPTPTKAILALGLIASTFMA